MNVKIIKPDRQLCKLPADIFCLSSANKEILKSKKSYVRINVFFSISPLSFNLGIYFSVCLALMVISLLETVIITNVLHHSSMKYQEVPNWVRVVVLKHIANLICYRWPEDILPPSVPQKDKPDISSNGVSESCVIQPAIQMPAQQPPSNGGKQTDLENGKNYLRDIYYENKHKEKFKLFMSKKGK